MSILIKCPCCDSTLRVSVETVVASKPAPSERQLRLDEGKLRVAPDDRMEIALAAIERVAIRNGVTLEDLRGRSKAEPLVHIRQEAMWAARTEALVSYDRIGELLDRDHSTVLMGIRSHEARRAA